MSNRVKFDLTGRVVIVTGVGRPGQIGHATALACARAGAGPDPQTRTAIIETTERRMGNGIFLGITLAPPLE